MYIYMYIYVCISFVSFKCRSIDENEEGHVANSTSYFRKIFESSDFREIDEV